jgi:hypothetical protein
MNLLLNLRHPLLCKITLIRCTFNDNINVLVEFFIELCFYDNQDKGNPEIVYCGQCFGSALV